MANAIPEREISTIKRWGNADLLCQKGEVACEVAGGWWPANTLGDGQGHHNPRVAQLVESLWKVYPRIAQEQFVEGVHFGLVSSASLTRDAGLKETSLRPVRRDPFPETISDTCNPFFVKQAI